MIRRAAALAAAVALVSACSGPPEGTMRELQRARAGGLDVVLLAPSAALPRGQGFAILEFRESSGALVNVGTVRVRATMPHPGAETMVGRSDVKPTPAPGRYEISTDFSMAGNWFFDIEWEGQRGRGSVRLEGTVSEAAFGSV
jgi:hypothetical protein